MMSATCAKPSVRSRCSAAFGEKPRERVVALDAAVGEVARAARRRARPAPSRRERTSRSRRGGARGAPGSARGWRSLDLLERQPARLVHQVDEPEVARAEHDDVLAGDVVLRRASAGLRRVPVASSTACRRSRSFSSPPATLATRRVRSSEPLDELVEAVAVALLEGRALGLPVVGEDDDLVRAAARSGARARSGRTAGRACAAPRACRRARARSGARPRRSSRTSRRPRAARGTCP